MNHEQSLGRTLSILLLAPLWGACKVTGVDANDPLYNDTQSETAINISRVNGTSFITVAYNTPGVSGWIGYSYWDANVLAWVHKHDLTLPPGWTSRPDPSITTVPGNEQFVYLAALGETTNQLNGVCIWRSTDAARNFSFWQCVKAPDATYDGTALTASADNRIYAATWAADKARIDVYRASSVTQTFSRLSGDPFPGFTVSTHPRLRTEARLTFGAPTPYILWVAAVTRDNQLVVNGYHSLNNVWSTPKVIASNVVTSASDTRDIVLSNGVAIRVGPQFSFDVGYDDVSTAETTLRAGFSRHGSDGRYSVRGVRCVVTGPAQLGTCTEEPGWASDSGGAGASGDQFGPLVAWNGRLGGPNTWVLSYSSRQENPTGSTISFWGGKLRRDQPFSPARVFNPTEACGGGLLWGDYDDMRFLGIGSDGSDVFVRSHTDSSVGAARGCANGGAEGDQHVSLAVVN